MYNTIFIVSVMLSTYGQLLKSSRLNIQLA